VGKWENLFILWRAWRIGCRPKAKTAKTGHKNKKKGWPVSLYLPVLQCNSPGPDDASNLNQRDRKETSWAVWFGSGLIVLLFCGDIIDFLAKIDLNANLSFL
jgi:hypothetical protein